MEVLYQQNEIDQDALYASQVVRCLLSPSRFPTAVPFLLFHEESRYFKVHDSRSPLKCPPTCAGACQAKCCSRGSQCRANDSTRCSEEKPKQSHKVPIIAKKKTDGKTPRGKTKNHMAMIEERRLGANMVVEVESKTEKH